MQDLTLSHRKLIAILGSWSTGPGPLHQRLAAALRGGVARGELAPGTRLPAERVLAQALSVSRGTVVAAYEALRNDGVLHSRQGSGTYVPAAGRGAGPPPDRSAPLRRNVVTQGILEGVGPTVPLLGAHVNGALGLSPELLLAAHADLAPELAGSGYLPLGLPALREAVARDLCAQGLPTEAEQVLITSGAQQAISLAVALLVQPGDAVAVENPTYLTAIDIFTTAGARLLPVPLGPEGVLLDRLRETIDRGAPRLLYLIPTFHNPTGAVLPERARREIAALAQRGGVPILEDLALAELAISAVPPAPIAAFAGGGVLTVGSMSKVFWAGLRVGWVRAEAEVVRRLARLKVVHDLATSPLTQAVAVRLLLDADRLRAVRRDEAARSLALLTGLLREHLPTWSYAEPAGGLCLWVRLPAGSAGELAQVALRHGVSIVPGPLTSPDGSFGDHLRLPLMVEEGLLSEGVRRLAAAWRAYAPAAERQRATGEVLV